jgi:hypothetical protein
MLPLGSASSSLEFRVSCRRMLWVSTTGAAADTVIVSDSAPTANSTLTWAVKPVGSSIPSRTTREKPSRLKVTV